jgi:hypothetical protein
MNDDGMSARVKEYLNGLRSLNGEEARAISDCCSRIYV